MSSCFFSTITYGGGLVMVEEELGKEGVDITVETASKYSILSSSWGAYHSSWTTHYPNNLRGVSRPPVEDVCSCFCKFTIASATSRAPTTNKNFPLMTILLLLFALPPLQVVVQVLPMPIRRTTTTKEEELRLAVLKLAKEKKRLMKQPFLRVNKRKSRLESMSRWHGHNVPY